MQNRQNFELRPLMMKGLPLTVTATFRWDWRSWTTGRLVIIRLNDGWRICIEKSWGAFFLDFMRLALWLGVGG